MMTSRFARLGYTGVVLGLLFTFLVFFLTGCGSSRHHNGDPVNLYLTNCRTVELEDGVFEIVSDIVLPTDYYGVIYVDGEQTTDTIVLESGELVLGTFQPTEDLEITYCLELLYVGPEGDLTRADLQGIVECCTFFLGAGDILPPPDLTSPTLNCNLNVEGGAVTVIVILGDATKFTLRGGGLDVTRHEDFSADLLDLEPGEHTFTVEAKLGEETVHLSCTVTILEPEEPEYPEDDDDDKKCKKRCKWMTYKGDHIVVPCKWEDYYKRKGAKPYGHPRH